MKLFFRLLELILFFVVFSVSVLAFQVTVSTPTAGQEFTVGDNVEIRFTTDANMTYVGVQALGPSQGFIIAERSFGGGASAYRTTWNTTGFPVGSYLVVVNVYYRENGDFRFIRGTVSPVFLNAPDLPPADANAPVRVIRTAADTIRPRSSTRVFLNVLPMQDFTGIVLTEKIPSGVRVDGPAAFDYRFDPILRELKIVLKATQRIGYVIVPYSLIDSSGEGLPIGTVLPLEGSWEILEQSGDTIGIGHITVEGVAIPNCPIPDSVLLEYIDKWSKLELDAEESKNDMYMLEVIRKWKEC